MSKYLLDTHTLLWFQGSESKIPLKIMKLIQDQNNQILFSQLCLFEIAIKQAINKLPEFRSDVDEIYHQGLKDGFTFLSIQNDHISAYKKIPFMEQHRDPFDRLLLATAYRENAAILSADKKFHLYNDLVEVLW